jgi:hypothetical protein
MLALPPTLPSVGWWATVRLGRDHYVRMDTNNYSVHPSPIGRKAIVGADLNAVREVFGDNVVAAAMIDRLVHHAEVIALKGDSYRLKDRDLGRVPAATTTKQP